MVKNKAIDVKIIFKNINNMLKTILGSKDFCFTKH